MNKKFYIKKFYIIMLIIIFIMISPFIKFDFVISDERYFHVVDENGSPIPNCEVHHRWTQYALEYEKIDLSSCDNDGFVYLPKRTVRTSWAELIMGAYNQFQKYGIHASYMSDDMVAVSAPGYESELIWSYHTFVFEPELSRFSYRKSNKIVLKKKQPR